MPSLLSFSWKAWDYEDIRGLLAKKLFRFIEITRHIMGIFDLAECLGLQRFWRNVGNDLEFRINDEL